jgi:hypothetical protein
MCAFADALVVERPRFRLRQAYGAIRQLPDEADLCPLSPL